MVMEHVPNALSSGMNASSSCLLPFTVLKLEPKELKQGADDAIICRLQQHLSAGEHQQDLFREQPLVFVSSLSQPPCHSLTELVQLCGGTVCRSVRQAGICIGKYKGKRPEGTKCLSEQWVLDCVTHHLLLPYDNYILE
ncbi:microcephalin isoform X1 [Tachysurus ichikawai]